MTDKRMAKLIDGRVVAEKVYTDLRADIAELKTRGVTPGLAVVLIGDDPASRAYVRSKDKMCRELGLHSVKLELPASTTQSELLARVGELNRDSTIHGILVQSPPPEHIDEAAIEARGLAPLVRRLRDVLTRFADYDTRIDAALRRARTGEHGWVDRSDLDSCHRAWFELHEDLLATLGLDRHAQP